VTDGDITPEEERIAEERAYGEDSDNYEIDRIQNRYEDWMWE
jgi:hypothetical protein